MHLPLVHAYAKGEQAQGRKKYCVEEEKIYALSFLLGAAQDRNLRMIRNEGRGETSAGEVRGRLSSWSVGELTTKSVHTCFLACYFMLKRAP